MKLIAVDESGKHYPIIELSPRGDKTFVIIKTGEQSFEYIFDGDKYTLHISTCTFDKHGREILVGDIIKYKNPDALSGRVWYNSDGFIVVQKGGYVHFTELTPELAATMEVVS